MAAALPASRALYATMGAGWLLSLLFMSRTGVSMLHLLVRLYSSLRTRDRHTQSSSLPDMLLLLVRLCSR